MWVPYISNDYRHAIYQDLSSNQARIPILLIIILQKTYYYYYYYYYLLVYSKLIAGNAELQVNT